jgi:hypothetical protein
MAATSCYQAVLISLGVQVLYSLRICVRSDTGPHSITRRIQGDCSCRYTSSGMPRINGST